MARDRLSLGASTRAVHSGERQHRLSDAVTVPVYQTSTYVFESTQQLIDFKEGRIEKGEYGRYGNPTVRQAEQKIAELDHAQDAILWASGMCAMTSLLLTILQTGQHMIITSDSYRRTQQFCSGMLRRFGIDVSIVPPGDPDAIEAAVCPNTRLILTESPTNPFLYVIDLEKLVEIAKRHRIRTVIDSTLAAPYNQNPLDFGIDLVMHSATKYLAGHNDLLAGVVVGKAGMIDALRESQGILGGITDPNSAYLLLRGLKSFALRMAQHNANGAALASFLEAHPKVRRVYYPGLKSHPSHAVARAQMRGFGGLVSFELDATMAQTGAFIDALELPYMAPSLGGVESLVEQPAIVSYYEMAPEERHQIGISDSLVRYAAGIEDTDDLLTDVEQALKVLG
ncbi:trans-sulfuration enzyme family protein [Candidatus Entotheonella palauensis]|uniref:trans-sulfuration enzyme family protein n=1 Tax=Candidatus Entotheonella palauensis TaxID=93172 RepID=UPI000B7FE968|nr:aminotransferase class I/II-fold pyridoxal phosphate-dependent enzyme [Candidatus Entotheonella palauensis]